MISHVAKMPPATHFFRAERKERPSGWLDKMARRAAGRFLRPLYERDGRTSRFLAGVERYGERLQGLTDAQLEGRTAPVRHDLRRKGFTLENIAHSFALIREVSARVLNMRHFHTQLIGGWVLMKGMVAEMETGEGKTLMATLAAGTAALAGIPVHVITVNDYLTARDAEWMGPLYRFLGLKAGFVVHGMQPEARRAAYDCDITYCTNKEITFDYLRDWIVLEGRVQPLRLQAESLYGDASRVRRLLLRGLHYAIVDEADSVLVDEARVPLIISRSTANREEQSFMEQAMEIAGCLEQGVDFSINEAARKVKLSEEGIARIREQTLALGPLWRGSVRREEIVRLALTARHLFHRDEEYLVQDGKVQIVDEFTGRVMADRSYEGGLHQLIEIKEGCETSQRPETVARISYQRFFKRYLHLSGMTGTAREVKAELWSVYGLSVARIPLCREMRRRRFPDQIHPLEDEKWQAVAERIREMHAQGRPVLVGTRSVAASEKASRQLTEIGLAHEVLNARQDQEEARIISRAGEVGALTIATNMAGRGTDIRLGPGVEESGGLHVIITERHEAGRIDRQLAGRCGRLGDSGSHEAILSLEDDLFKAGKPGLAGWLAARFACPCSPLWTWMAGRAFARAQKRVERLQFRIRKALLREDEKRGDMLSFSGRSE